MTTPGGYGGRGAPPLDYAAQSAIGSVRPQANPWLRGQPPRPSLSEEERAEAQKSSEVCRFCIGIHKMANGPGCPRLATFKLNNDGEVVEGTFWPGKKWAKGRVVFVADAHEEDDADAAS